MQWIPTSAIQEQGEVMVVYKGFMASVWVGLKMCTEEMSSVPVFEFVDWHDLSCTYLFIAEPCGFGKEDLVEKK